MVIFEKTRGLNELFAHNFELIKTFEKCCATNLKALRFKKPINIFSFSYFRILDFAFNVSLEINVEKYKRLIVLKIFFKNTMEKSVYKKN